MFWIVFYPQRRSKHQINIKKADKVLKKLQGMQCNEQRLHYLRKINPFVFEEVVLNALLAKGHKIKRNKRYTGDGGIDGKVYIKGKLTLVQSKRYSGHISRKHVIEFVHLCKKKRCKGLFVHTGRASKQTLLAAKNIEIISGPKLMSLLTT